MERDLAERVRAAVAVEPDEFRARAEADAEVVKEALRDGAFDNHQSIVGLEYEFYAAATGRWAGDGDDGAGALMRVPRRLLELIGFEKELGLHNAEMTTDPQPMNAYGLRAQREAVRAGLSAALECTAAEGMRLVSDGMWTIPPAGERARDYLTDSVDDDGVRVATNMSDAVRYHAMANGPGAPDRMGIDAPHVSLSADTVMPESLITSIQPHFQVARAADLPAAFNYAVRVAGPLLALAVNSPFFPPDLYDTDDPERVLADAHDEHRIGVFESVLNRPDADKVRFPRDLDTVAAAVDRIAADPITAPMPAEDEADGDRFDDDFATFRLKHGTYWRWVRPVFDGPTRSGANARIEFRPIPAQPTVEDSLAFQAAFAGLLTSLPRRRHPVADQDWSVARENFYAAAREGLDAEIGWITNDGQETTATEAVYDDLLSHAVDGLRTAGFDAADAEAMLEPLFVRVREGVTPADWKRARVRERVEAGDGLAAAITGMQRAYLARQEETLLAGSLADWPALQ